MTILINGTALDHISPGIVYESSLDGDLESITFSYQTRTPIELHDLDIGTVIFDNGEMHRMLLKSYQKTVISKHPKLYSVAVVLVEMTKYLENIILPTQTFTNLNDNLQEQIEKILWNAQIDKHADSQSVFILDYDLVSNLTAVPAQEIVLEKPTLREALDETLSVLNFRSRVSGIILNPELRIYISYKNLRPLQSAFTLAKKVNESINFSGELAVNEIESYGTNALFNDRRTIIHGWDTFKATDGSATTDSNNAGMMLPCEIDEIKSLIIRVKTDINSIGANPDYIGYTEVDITEHVYPFELYSLLTIAEKKQALAYERGSASVGMNRTYKKWVFFEGDVLENILKKHINDGDALLPGTMGNYVLDFNYAWDKYTYKIEYIGFYDVHARIEKHMIPSKLQSQTSAFSNQSARTIDILRFGTRLRNDVNKIGNEEVSFDSLVTTPTDIIPVGSVSENGLICFKRTVEIVRGLYKVNYVLSKDYDNLGRKVGLDRTLRLYNIPLDNVERNTLIKEYVVIDSIHRNRIKTPILNSRALAVMLNTLIAQPEEFVRLNKVWIQTTDSSQINHGPYQFTPIVYTMDNSLFVSFSFYDNVSAGHSVGKRVIGGDATNLNPYVDSNGEYEKIDITLHGGENVRSVIAGTTQTGYKYYSDSQILADNKLLPYVESNQGTNYDETYSYQSEFKNYKDRMVKDSYTIQIAVISNNPNIFIGEPFIKNCSLLFGVNPNRLYFYYSTTDKYTKKDTTCKGYLTTISNSFVIDKEELSIAIDESWDDDIVSWALGDINRNMYIAVNMPIRKIYLSSHRSKLDIV